jgi:hypothetical protein
MPFVFIWGVAEDIPDNTLLQIRQTVVGRLAENMKTDPSWIRVFFPRERLGIVGDNDNDHIYISIDTGMFYSKPVGNDDPKSATQLVAQIVWESFDGQYEVECFIGNHNPSWVSLIQAKS